MCVATPLARILLGRVKVAQRASFAAFEPVLAPEGEKLIGRKVVSFRGKLRGQRRMTPEPVPRRFDNGPFAGEHITPGNLVAFGAQVGAEVGFIFQFRNSPRSTARRGQCVPPKFVFADD